MLPSLTVRPRGRPARRIALAAGSALLGMAALVSAVPAASPAPAPRMAQALRPATWALSVPTAWLVAPPPPLRPGDAVDVFSLRGGERAYVSPVAYGVTVVSADERALVLEVDEMDAVAIATARGSGMLLLTLLRSTR